MSLFSKKNKKCLGIDVSNDFVRIVEISKKEEGYKLENYGSARISEITGKKIKKEGQRFSLPEKEIAETIKAILKETGIKTKKSFFALPHFSSFLISFKMPKMEKEEIESAIHHQARQRVPLPLNEVTLDWNVSSKNSSDNGVDVFLLAVPNETIETYREIAKEGNLKIGALDSEIMGFSQIFGIEQKSVAVVNIKRWSTSINIITDQKPAQSSSLNISASNFEEDISTLSEIDFNQKDNRSEEKSKSNEKIKASLAEELFEKVEEVYSGYNSESDQPVSKIILTGRGSEIDEIKEEFFKKDIEVDISKPFMNINYPPVLEDAIDEMSPRFSVAVGMSILGLNS